MKPERKKPLKFKDRSLSKYERIEHYKKKARERKSKRK